MAKGKPGKAVLSKAERRHEVEIAKLEHRERLNLTDQLFKLLRQVTGGAVIVLCSYFIYLSVDSLAGKTTRFDSVISQMADFRVDQGVCMALALICGVGWRTERKLRRKTIKERGGHIRELEQRVAPERKSSGLLPDGTSKQEDKDDA